MNILLIGAGAWGTALAVSAATRHDVTLWARDAALVTALQAGRENARYLPGVALPESLRLQGGAGALGDAVRGQDLIVMATPVSAARGLLRSLQHAAAPVVWLGKGLEAALPATAGAA